MFSQKNPKPRFLVFTLISLSLLMLWPLIGSAAPMTAPRKLADAWQDAADIGVYHYETNIIQTTHPTHKLVNVGRSSDTQVMSISGFMDKPKDSMHMLVSGNGQGQVLELKLEQGLSYGRLKADDSWQEMDHESDLFAPGGDPLGYLNAAENIRLLDGHQYSAQAEDLDSVLDNPYILQAASSEIYTFDLNSLKYASFMRDQMEAQLRQQGELPVGVDLGMAETYLNMEGRGEIWLNERGLPVLQIIELDFPPERGALDRVEAKITTTFSDWGEPLNFQAQVLATIERIQHNPSEVINNPQKVFSSIQVPFNRAQVQSFVLFLGSLLILIGLFALVMAYWQSPKLYAAMALSVIVSMLFTPLMHSHQIQAFYQTQHTRQAEYDQTIERQESLDSFQAEVSGRSFDPRQDPLAGSRGNSDQSVAPPAGQIEPQFSQTESETDPFDPYRCDNLDSDDSTDDNDGDGLSDNVECNELGTDMNEVDTDNDGISDYVEVKGVPTGTNNPDWYLDPVNPDSNGDGLMDNVECPALVDVDAETNTLIDLSNNTVCQDSDGDGIPNIFDFDNDGDGVPDSVDASPDYVGELSTNAQPSFNLSLGGLDESEQRVVLVDFELRPTAYEHLYQTNNVFDWPSNDRKGQITRVDNSTFKTEGIDGLRTDHGDLMTIPMLEIEIPAPDDNGSNPASGLPVLPTVDVLDITNSTPLTAWLDLDVLSEYGISVRQDADTSVLYAYLPLTILEDNVGDTPVAWAAQMYYRPENGSWGSAQHNVRMLWMVRALIDTCDTSPDFMPDEFEDRDGRTVQRDDDDAVEAWCELNRYEGEQIWKTRSQIVQTYYEDFYLTGLSAREDYGMDLAIIAQNNATSVDYENYLWHLSNGLQANFGEGGQIDEDNDLIGDRRFDIGEVVTRFGSNTYETGDAELWDIPSDTFTVNHTSYGDYISGLDAMVDQVIPQVLDDVYGSPQAEVQVTLLIAREDNYKSTFLGNDSYVDVSTADDISSIEIDLSEVGRQTYSTLNWSPYEYNGLDWDSAPIENYLENLENNLADAISETEVETLFALFGEELSDYDALTRAGIISLLRNYYFTWYNGSTVLVEDSDLGGGINTAIVDDSLGSLDYDNDGDADEASLVLLAEIVGVMQAFFVGEGYFILDELNEIVIGAGSLDMSVGDGNEALIALITGSVDATGSGFKSMVKKFVKVKGSLKAYRNRTYVTKGVTSAGFIAGSLYATYSLTNDKYVGLAYAAASIEIAAGFVDLMDTYKVYKGFQRFKGLADLVGFDAAIKTVKKIKRSTRISAAIGLAADLASATAVFVLSVQGLDVGSLAYNALVVDYVVSIVIAVIYAAIAATLVGAIILAALALIDAFISLICLIVEEANGDDEDISEDVNTFVCNGITAAIIETVVRLVLRSGHCGRHGGRRPLGDCLKYAGFQTRSGFRHCP